MLSFTEEDKISRYITFFLINNKEIKFNNNLESNDVIMSSLQTINASVYNLLNNNNIILYNKLFNPNLRDNIRTALPWTIDKYRILTPIYNNIYDMIVEYGIGINDINIYEWINIENIIILNIISKLYTTNQKLLYAFLKDIILYVLEEGNRVGYANLLIEDSEYGLDKNFFNYFVRSINNMSLTDEQLTIFCNIVGNYNLNFISFIGYATLSELETKLTKDIFSYPIRNTNDVEINVARISPYTVEDFDDITLNKFKLGLVDNKFQRIVEDEKILFQSSEIEDERNI